MHLQKSGFSVRFSVLMACAALHFQAGNVFAQHNALTTEEAAAGYQLLFNGTDLSGWRAWNSVNPPASWSAAAESTWKVIQNGSGAAVPLVTVDSSFKNFDFKVEWNVPSAVNSGIFTRYDNYGKDEWGGASGPEAQVAAINHSDGSGETHRAGTCYDVIALDARAVNWDRPGGGVNYGMYHQFRIVAFNNRVAHFGNGMKLLEYEIKSPAWNIAYAASKYAAYPRYGDAHPGGIYFQHHGETGARFRDIRIKKLTQSPWAQGSPYLTVPGDSASGLRDLSFSDNLFPPVSALAPAVRNGEKALRVVYGAQGASLVFEQPGEYVVRIGDVRGRESSRSFVRGDRFLLPAGERARGASLVTVWTGNRKIHQELIRPLF